MECLRPDWAAPAQVQALVSLREGGASGGPYASLNLGDHVGDTPAAVADNRARLSDCFKLPSKPRWLEQVHGRVAVAAHALTAPRPQADAAWTNVRGVVCAVLTADCLPILLCDRAGTWVAAVHAGWRGLAEGVIASALEHFPGNGELLAWIGPGIGPGAYRVDDAFRARFMALDADYAPAFVRHADGWHCDLGFIASQQLTLAGIRAITRYPGCTHAEPDHFFSHRRDGVSGRFASLIWLA